ncbi:MAG: formyltransferase family protein [Steroidobacteraceae bacterium]
MEWLKAWIRKTTLRGHEVWLGNRKSELPGGDVLFLVSCCEIIEPGVRARYRASLVLHASDLPVGRGWSPHVWGVLAGANEITVCLVEAGDPVDSGRIWLRKRVVLEGHELFDEINSALFSAELALMTQVVEEFTSIKPEPQRPGGSWCRRRTPEDSRLDPAKSLAEQFNLLRVADSRRFPAFMDWRGRRYIVRIEKVEDDEQK